MISQGFHTDYTDRQQCLTRKSYKQKPTEDVSVYNGSPTQKKKRPDEFEMGFEHIRVWGYRGKVWVFIRYAMVEGNVTNGNLMFWDVQDQNSFQMNDKKDRKRNTRHILGFQLRHQLRKAVASISKRLPKRLYWALTWTRRTGFGDVGDTKILFGVGDLTLHFGIGRRLGPAQWFVY